MEKYRYISALEILGFINFFFFSSSETLICAYILGTDVSEITINGKLDSFEAEIIIYLIYDK